MPDLEFYRDLVEPADTKIVLFVMDGLGGVPRAPLGIDFALQPNDLAARGNFASMDEAGRITDRRAGRISTEKNVELCAVLRPIRLPGVEIFVEPGREARFVPGLRR